MENSLESYPCRDARCRRGGRFVDTCVAVPLIYIRRPLRLLKSFGGIHTGRRTETPYGAERAARHLLDDWLICCRCGSAVTTGWGNPLFLDHIHSLGFIELQEMKGRELHRIVTRSVP
jgi:hypothetical protein